eukprot:XP_001610456.1 hypothetical protein [Babesia bovis T2Bo]
MWLKLCAHYAVLVVLVDYSLQVNPISHIRCHGLADISHQYPLRGSNTYLCYLGSLPFYGPGRISVGIFAKKRFDQRVDGKQPPQAQHRNRYNKPQRHDAGLIHNTSVNDVYSDTEYATGRGFVKQHAHQKGKPRNQKKDSGYNSYDYITKKKLSGLVHGSLKSNRVADRWIVKEGGNAAHQNRVDTSKVPPIKSDPSFTGRSPVGHKGMNSQPTLAISMFNRRMAKDNQQLLRLSTEPVNPLLQRIAHSNQRKQKLRVSPLSEDRVASIHPRAKQSVEIVSSSTKATKLASTHPIESDKVNVVIPSGRTTPKSKQVSNAALPGTSNSHDLQDPREDPGYTKSLDFTGKEFNALELESPGMRSLRCDLSQGLTKRGGPLVDALNGKLDQLKSAGFDAIVDMNSLFSVSADVFADASHDETTPGQRSGFSSLGIVNKGLISAIAKHGISRATVTQSRYIPAIKDFLNTSSGEYEPVRSMVIHAPTGSGKTLAYLLPLLDRLLLRDIPLTNSDGTLIERDHIIRYLRALFTEEMLVLTPSIELSVQSHGVLKELWSTYDQMSETQESHVQSKPPTPLRSKAADIFRALGAKLLGRPVVESPSETHVNTVAPSVRLVSEIKPILLIGNANVSHQKRAIRDLRRRQQQLSSECTKAVDEFYNSLGKGGVSNASVPIEIRRVIGVMFVTPGRAHSLWKTHKLLDPKRVKYCVIDEYDGLLQLKRVVKSTSKELENSSVKAVLDAMLSGVKPSPRISALKVNTGKYVLCLSASRLDTVPECFGKLGEIVSGCKDIQNGQDIQLDQGDEDSVTDNSLPPNILHTMAVYSVPDAKLALLRKILQAHPYDKSALIFCDSNGTAQFLESYLGDKFPSSEITVLNCRQTKLERKRSFQTVIQSNLSGSIQFKGRSRKGGSRPVQSIVLSTQLNSRGIDFSGFTHVIHYDLPHDLTAYMHRSGRIGRVGNPGISISLVERKLLPVFSRVITRRLGTPIHNIETHSLVTMDVFPTDASFFRNADYWGRFYSNPKLKDFDWYGTLDDFLSSFNRCLYGKVPFDASNGYKHDPGNSVVINVGCGNSLLPFRLYDMGYTHVYNLDFCRSVLDEMRGKDHRNSMHWVDMDVSSSSYTAFGSDIATKFNDHSKIIIDKAFFDAYISVAEGESQTITRDRARCYIEATLSFMDRDDMFLIFSLAQDYVVVELVRNLLFKDYYVDIYPLYNANSKKAHMIQFLFGIYRKGPATAKRRQCLMSEMPHIPLDEFEIGALPKRISTAKGAVVLGSNLGQYSAGRRVTFDIYPKDLKTKVCFTAAVYDRLVADDVQIPTAAIIIPTGQEHYWQYASSEGNEELAQQAGAQRIIILWLKFSSSGDSASVPKGFVNPFDACFGDDVLMTYIQDNMGDILLRISLRGTKKVTILKAGESCAFRAPRKVASSIYAGDIVVHEILANDYTEPGLYHQVITRQMVFSCSPQTVQSEVRYYVNDDGTEVFLSNSPLSEYLTAMMLSTAFMPRGSGILSVLGSGSGSLPRCLRVIFPDYTVHAVDIDDMVTDIAKAHFGYSPDATVRILSGQPCTDHGPALVHISGDAMDYLDYVGDIDISCIMVDINNVLDDTGDSDFGKSTLMSPHPNFLDTAWLTMAASKLERTQGILVMNILTRSCAVLDSVLHRLSSVFTWVAVIKMPTVSGPCTKYIILQDANKVAVCLNSDVADARERFGAYVS